MSKARKEADLNDDKKPLGNTLKLKDNTFHGKMIEDKEKHKNVYFSSKDSFITNKFNDPPLKKENQLVKKLIRLK